MRYLVTTSEVRDQEIIREYLVEAEDTADAEAKFASGEFLSVREVDTVTHEPVLAITSISRD